MKNKVIRKLISILPSPVRHPVIRQNLKLPGNTQSNFEFKLINTENEFLESVRLLHDCYVQAKYMNPDPTGFRITPYHLLPDTITAVAKFDGKVVATMSLVRDNPLGLPMDKIFDLKDYRLHGQVLCEVSALAIHKDFRGQQGELLHSLIRYLWRYSYEWYHVDYFVIAVNPSMVDLYEAFYLFRKLRNKRQINKYNFVNDAPAIGLFRSVSDSFDAFEKVYKNRPPLKNLYQFMSANHLNKIISQKKYFNISESIVNHEFLKYLYSRISQWDQKFSTAEQTVISNTHGFKNFSSLLLEPKFRQSQRFTSHCPVLFSEESNPSQPYVQNISKEGLLINFSKASKIAINAKQVLNIKIGKEIQTKILAEKIWENKSGQVGMRVIKADKEWQRFTEYLVNRRAKDEIIKLAA